MRKASRALGTALLLASFAMLALAAEKAEVTLSGTVVCAKCTLKEPGRKECQSVLVVEGEGAGQYYITKNDVADAFGHVCGGKKLAVVTGFVEERDGKTWITATKIEPREEG
jgi:hypothetical protein